MLEVSRVTNMEHRAPVVAKATPHSGRSSACKPLITPEQADNKAHMALAALDGLPESHGLSVSDIAQRTGLSRRIWGVCSPG